MQHEAGFFAEPRNWVLIAFLLFFILFGRKLWGALAGMLDARAVTVKTELEEAARLRREAEAMLRDAEKQRTDAPRWCSCFQFCPRPAELQGNRTGAVNSLPPLYHLRRYHP